MNIASILGIDRSGRQRAPRTRTKLRHRLASETEQALIRLVIATMLPLYLYYAIRHDPHVARSGAEFLYVGGAVFLVTAVVLYVAARFSLIPRHGLRVGGLVIDFLVPTYCMYFLGEYGAIGYTIYLWAVIGHGFRFGPRYLAAAGLVAIAGFVFILATNPYWQTHRFLGLALLIGLVALPAFFLVLSQKLIEARNRAREASRAKSRFFANMSHEIRTPLNAIIGMSDLLQESNLDKEHQDGLSAINSSGHILLGLVNNLLDMSKIEAGRLVLEDADFDLHECVKQTVEITNGRAQEKGLRLSVHITPETPSLLRGDPLRLQQILLNLVGNAIKFTDEGSVKLRVSAIREMKRAAVLRFEVIDTGIGIPKELQAHIFGRFVQADESTTRQYGGTGLGTAIAKDLVELMGGKIGVESEPQEGSCFWFEVEFPIQASSDALVDQPAFLRDKRVLLVAPRGNSADTVSKFLTEWGIGECSATTAAQGLAKLISGVEANNPFHVAIVIDDDSNAFAEDFARVVHSEPALRDAALILITPGGDKSDLEKAQLDGVRATISTKIDKTSLFNALHFVQTEEAEQPGITRLAERYESKRPASAPRHILIADDNVVNQKVIGEILKRAGDHVHIAGNGEEALDALEEQDFDLVLMDVHMPVLSGLDAAKLYQFSAVGKERTPIIALTADVSTDMGERCKAAGMIGYLVKPINRKRLLESIDSVLGAHQDMLGEGGEIFEQGQSGQTTDDTTEQPMIDPGTLRELEELGGGTEFVKELVAEFLNETRDFLAGMNVAAQEQDAERLWSLNHALKNSFASVGATRLLAKCRDFEHEDRQDIIAIARQHIIELERNMTTLRNELSEVALQRQNVKVR